MSKKTTKKTPPKKTAPKVEKTKTAPVFKADEEKVKNLCSLFSSDKNGAKYDFCGQIVAWTEKGEFFTNVDFLR